MNQQVKKALLTLGFVESVEVDKIPKMKTITKKYHKLALIHHPDKPGGDGEVFKEISASYLFLGNYLEEIRGEDCSEDVCDFEEEVARKTFHQFQQSDIKQNMRSFTIHIENNLSFIWDKVLTKYYGVSVDKNENGQHWKIEKYTDGYSTGSITIGKWHIPKRDKQSKLHVQSNEKGNFLPAHFVDNVLPKLVEEVHASSKLSVQATATDRSQNMKEIKTKQNGSKCKECDFEGKNLNGLNAHMKMCHKKVPKSKSNKIKTPICNPNSTSVDDFARKFNLCEGGNESSRSCSLKAYW